MNPEKINEAEIQKLIEGMLGTPPIEDEFGNVVAGETVTMVATSSHIRGTGIGPEIDAAGPVMRFSTCLNMAPFDDDLALDIGRRNDLYYFVPSYLRQFAGTPGKSIKKCLDAGVRHIAVNVVEYPEPMFLEYRGTRQLIEKMGRKLKESSAPTTIGHGEEAMRLSRQLLLAAGGHDDILARGGFQALIDLVLHGAHVVSTRGMTFYHGGDNFSRKDSLPSLEPNRHHHGNRSGSHKKKKRDKHDSRYEVLVVNRMYRIKPTLFDFDPVFQEIMERYDKKK